MKRTVDDESPAYRSLPAYRATVCSRSVVKDYGMRIVSPAPAPRRPRLYFSVFLQALPVDPTIVRDLRTLRKAETSWDALLDPSRFYRFVYALQVNGTANLSLSNGNPCTMVRLRVVRSATEFSVLAGCEPE